MSDFKARVDKKTCELWDNYKKEFGTPDTTKFNELRIEALIEVLDEQFISLHKELDEVFDLVLKT